MTPILALAIGFGAGAVLATLLAVVMFRRAPGLPPPPAPVPAARELPVPPPSAATVEREVAAVWLQFLRREVADTVGAINTRLTVIKTLLKELLLDERTATVRVTIERIGVEVDRTAAATDTLHTHVSSTAPERAAPSIMAAHAARPQRGVVLLVESDETTRDVVGQLLRRLGHRVIPVGSGPDALRMLEREPVECVVSETRASQLSGPALHAQVEELMPHLARRFVFISGDTQVPEVRTFLESCDCPVIPKPFDVELLVQAVSDVVSRAAQDRAAQEQASRSRPPTSGARQAPA